MRNQLLKGKSMKTQVFVVLAGLMLTHPSFAHEGHDTVPGAIQAPHGGTMKGAKEYYIELVNDTSGIKLYPFTHDLKPVPTGDVTITATAQAPKKKKEKVNLTAIEDHFEAKVDAKGAYRYTLELEVAPKGAKAKKEKIAFQVEPQS